MTCEKLIAAIQRQSPVNCICDASLWDAVSPLEGFGAEEWVVFERALVVRDLFTGGTRTFHSTPDAQAFRAALYQQYGAAQSLWTLFLALYPSHPPLVPFSLAC